MQRRRWAVAAAIAALAGGIAGCGGGDDSEEGGGDSGGSAEVKSVPGFDGKTIKLGVLTPQTGPVAVIGKPLTNGNRVYWESVNAKGGVAGKYKVELVEEDTQYRPDLTVQKYNKVKGDVVAFQQVLGTAPTLALVPQLQRDNMIAAPASLDAFWVKNPNLLPIGGPYQVQAINALTYWNDTEGKGGKKPCAMIQDDAYGEAGLEGLEFGAERLGIKLATVQRYKTGDKDVTGQVQRLRSSGCDMVFLVAVPSDAGTVWGTAAKLKFAPRWIGQSPAWIDELGESPLAEYLQQTTWIAAEGTEWGDTRVAGMDEMVNAVKQHSDDQEPDYYFAFGYNQARAMQALLEKAVADGDLSKEGIRASLDNLGVVDFKGLTADYQYGADGDRNPPRSSTIFKVNPEKPFALEVAKYAFESQAARDFEFEEASGT